MVSIRDFVVKCVDKMMLCQFGSLKQVLNNDPFHSEPTFLFKPKWNEWRARDFAFNTTTTVAFSFFFNFCTNFHRG